jgi:predicted Zn-ribbon and HTH transcriptional regulator
MSRPALEVADIFRNHGAAWRSANAGHVSLDQLKVMSAIERCRTAALGGHVARCEKCSHTVITYNSCRNRHCPKCQGAAAKQWLTERQAELLPAPYFHVVFTLPGLIADIAYQNKAVIYDLLFRAAADTMLTIAADPKHLGASIGITAVLHTWGSAMTHHPHLHMIVPGGGLSLDGKKWLVCRPGFFLPVRVLSRLFRRLFLKKLKAAHAAGRLCFHGEHSPLAERQAFTTYLQPLRKSEWVVYAKRPFGGPDTVRLSVALHPPRRYRQSPPDRSRRQHRQLPLQGLSDRRPCSPQGNDARDHGVHSPLSHARAAERLPPHPPLRPVRNALSCRQHCPRPSAARGITSSR